MTDLEKRADEYAIKVAEKNVMPKDGFAEHLIRQTYLDATKAETALLSQHILDLQKDKGNLTDRVRELEAQIAELREELAKVCNLKGCGRIKELEAQIEKMKLQYDYAFNQLCESREIVCLMLSQYKNKEEIDYSTRERGEKLLKQGVYKYD